MASGSTPIEGGLGELLAQTVVNLGSARPTSLGEGELLNAINTAVLAFTPPSLDAVTLGPAGTTGASMPRALIDTVTTADATGVLQMVAISLPANTVVNNINWQIGTTGSGGPTHQWGALYDSTRHLLAISADGTSTAITASAPLVFLAVANVSSVGAATSFTTTYTGLYYLGLMVSSSSAQPTLATRTSVALAATTVPPILAGTSTGSLTTPSTFPTTAGTITPTATIPYAYTT